MVCTRFPWIAKRPHGHKFRLAITDPEASPSTSATAPAPADQVIAAIRELIESAAIETKRKHASERTDGDLDAGRNSAIAALAELRAIR